MNEVNQPKSAVLGTPEGRMVPQHEVDRLQAECLVAQAKYEQRECDRRREDIRSGLVHLLAQKSDTVNADEIIVAAGKLENYVFGKAP